jgi:ubiquinone/menaquinone biosynthesis C-methylase UbiE
MKPETVKILCSPITKEPLKLVSEPGPKGRLNQVLISTKSGERFPIQGGIPIFLDKANVSGWNQKFQKFYDATASYYSFVIRTYFRLKSGSEAKARWEYLKELEIDKDSKVLEVSIGTGDNLSFLPDTASYFGLDISSGMLKQCQKAIRRLRLDVELFQGAAERLPFVDETFHVVFHVGGINFFTDKVRAIQEMIRVAKPGTKIVVVDETEKVFRKYERVPVMGKYYRNWGDSLVNPTDLVPADMLDVKVENIIRGELYCLSFRKPH